MKRKQGLFLAVIMACMWAVIIKEYIREGTRRWFKEALPGSDIVANWTEEQLDSELYKFSRWDGFTQEQFRQFVYHQIRPLRIDTNQTFRFMEVGVGVGAFARYILQMFPFAVGTGIDLEGEVIAIAEKVLPRARMNLSVSNMVRIGFAESNGFDFVFVPGALCYLHSLLEVQTALGEFARITRSGGAICASMLASATSEMGSCNVRLPKETWSTENLSALKLKCFSLEEMDEWHLPHSMGRYSVCLKKV
jgi:SAM-dependent methyltransferase